MRTKKWIKDIKDTIIVIVTIIALTVIIISIVWNYCELKNVTNAIVSIIGIVLAFISIFLSYKGLMVTNKVKEDVSLQQFKNEQQKAVAELINDINTFDFLIDFFKDGEKDLDTAMFHRVNLNGVLKMSETHKGYNDIEVFLDSEFSFSPARLCGRAYMPPSIAYSLSQFLQGYPRKQLPFKRSYSNAVIIRQTDFHTKELFHSTNGIYVNWGSFVNGTKNLIDKINEWYITEYGIATPNFISRDLVKIETDYLFENDSDQ